MDKIKLKVKQSSDRGLFHDSRKDIRLLGEVVNLLIDKVNKLIDENHKLKQAINKDNEHN